MAGFEANIWRRFARVAKAESDTRTHVRRSYIFLGAKCRKIVRSLQLFSFFLIDYAGILLLACVI